MASWMIKSHNDVLILWHIFVRIQLFILLCIVNTTTIISQKNTKQVQGASLLSGKGTA